MSASVCEGGAFFENFVPFQVFTRITKFKTPAKTHEWGKGNTGSDTDISNAVMTFKRVAY